MQLLGSGAILQEVLAAAKLLEETCGVIADIWSVTSFNELKRDGDDVERWNRLHPSEPPRKSHVSDCLDGRAGPVIAATDYVRLYADQIRSQIESPYVVLGTDGFGRVIQELGFVIFEVDRYHIAHAALYALHEMQVIDSETYDQPSAWNIDADKLNPVSM